MYNWDKIFYYRIFLVLETDQQFQTEYHGRKKFSKELQVDTLNYVNILM